MFGIILAIASLISALALVNNHESYRPMSRSFQVASERASAAVAGYPRQRVYGRKE
jgi:hypothetical protein